MARLSLILALYAAGVVTWLAFLREAPPAPGAADPGADTNGTPTDAMIRAARTAADSQVQESIRPHLADLDARLARLENIRKDYERILGDVQDAAELTAELGRGGVEKLGKQLAEIEARTRTVSDVEAQAGKLTEALARLLTQHGAQGKRLAELENQVRELASRPQAPVAPTGPTQPTLPDEEPDVGAAEAQGIITQALMDLDSKDRNRVFAALQRLGQLKARPAAPRIILVLQNHKDEFLRRAAAMSLGKMESCDAVPVLIDTIADRDQGVALQAARSVFTITGYEVDVSGDFRTKARRKARTEALAWWKKNEGEVRERLGQPASEG